MEVSTGRCPVASVAVGVTQTTNVGCTFKYTVARTEMPMLRTGSHRIRMGAALGVLALVLTACGSDDSSSPTGTPEDSDGGESSAPAASDSTLVVWADNSANTAKAIEPLCQEWAEANGVTCQVKSFNGGAELQEALIRAQDTGDVP